MNSNNKSQPGKDVFEIDLIAFAQACLRNIILIIIVAALFAGMMFAYARYGVTPMYKTSALIYVNNNRLSLGAIDSVISTSDISAAKSLVNTYIVILKTRTTLEEVISRSGVGYSYGALSRMISAEAVDNTEIFRVTVSGSDPVETELIANTICDVLPDAISDVVDGSAVRIVDYAVVPTSSYAPSCTKYAFIGLAVGALLAVAYVFINFISDDIVHGEDDITSEFDIPLLAGIPDLAERSSGGYDYGYGYSRKSKKGGRR